MADFMLSKNVADIYNDGTPASPWVEGDALTGWSTQGGATFVSSTEEAFVGTRSIKISSPTGSFQGAKWAIPGGGILNDPWRLKVWIKTIATSAYLRNWVRLDLPVEIPIISDGLWHYYEVDTVVNAAGATEFNFYAAKDAGSPGDSIYVDGMEVLPPASDVATTTKTTWIDSASPGVIGHKVFRNDVEIADVGMGVQVWYDDIAEKGVIYKYEVQAYSATQETADEVVNTNVKSITTAV